MKINKYNQGSNLFTLLSGISSKCGTDILKSNFGHPTAEEMNNKKHHLHSARTNLISTYCQKRILGHKPIRYQMPPHTETRMSRLSEPQIALLQATSHTDKLHHTQTTTPANQQPFTFHSNHSRSPWTTPV